MRLNELATAIILAGLLLAGAWYGVRAYTALHEHKEQIKELDERTTNMDEIIIDKATERMNRQDQHLMEVDRQLQKRIHRLEGIMMEDDK